MNGESGLGMMDRRPPAVFLRKLRRGGFGRVLKVRDIGSCPRGFTLLELIISLTILSLIAVIIGSGFRLGLNAWKKGEEEAEAVQTMRVLTGLIFQQLKSAYPYRIKLDDEHVVVFEGRRDSIIFATTLSSPYPGGFKWVRYLHKDGRLLYKEGVLPDKELLDNIDGDEEVVETGVEEAAFSYYSAEDEEWKDSWEFGDKLPGAVRMRISYFQPIFVNIAINREMDDEEMEEGWEMVTEEL